MAEFAKKAILAGAIALGGVSAANAGDFESRLGGGFKVGGGRLTNDLNTQDRLVYVHPADGGKEKGGVLLDVKEAYGAQFSVYAEGVTGTENLKLKAGIEGILNSFSKEDREDQPLPPPYHSIGWAEFSEDIFSYKPYVGVEVRYDLDTDMAVFLGADMGWPRTGFDFKKGDQRYGVDNTEFSDSWNGFGKSYTVYLSAGPKGEKDEVPGKVYFSWTREEYDTDICGGTEVKNNIFSIGLCGRF